MVIGSLGGGRLKYHHQRHHCHDNCQLAEWILVAFAVLMVDKSKARWKRHLCQDSQLNREHLCQGAFVSRPNKRDNFVRPTKKESWTLKRTDAFPRLVFLHLFCPQTLQRRKRKNVKDRKIFQDSLQSRSQTLQIKMLHFQKNLAFPRLVFCTFLSSNAAKREQQQFLPFQDDKGYKLNELEAAEGRWHQS